MSTILNNIKQIVMAADEQASVILFGSRARGDFKEDSDWDILVLNSELTNLQDVQKNIREKIWEIEKQTGEAINLVFCSKTEWIVRLGATLFFKKVNEEGKEL